MATQQLLIGRIDHFVKPNEENSSYMISNLRGRASALMAIGLAYLNSCLVNSMRNIRPCDGSFMAFERLSHPLLQ